MNPAFEVDSQAHDPFSDECLVVHRPNPKFGTHSSLALVSSIRAITPSTESAVHNMYHANFDYTNSNASQPSLTHSMSTHPDSTPSSVCRPDFADYTHAEFSSSDLGQVTPSVIQTPFDDDSDIDEHISDHTSAPHVTFVTPVIERSQPSVRATGMKKKAHRRQLANATEPHLAMSASTAGHHPENLGLAFPNVPFREQPLIDAGRIRTRPRANSQANPPSTEMESLSFNDKPMPPLPRSGTTESLGHTGMMVPLSQVDSIPESVSANGTRPPLSVLDEFEWHDSSSKPRFVSVDSQDDPLNQTIVRSVSRLDSIDSISRQSSTKLVPSPNIQRHSGDSNVFAFSPPSLVHVEYQGAETVTSSNASRSSLCQIGSPSQLSVSSCNTDPIEIIRLAKTAKITCGLDQEIHSDRSASGEDAEILADDLPPLLSTHYLNGHDFPKLTAEQYSRLNRNPDRIMAVHPSPLPSDRSKPLSSKSKRSKPPMVSRVTGEPISILAAEAKFLAQTTKDGEKSKGLIKKKVSSKQRPSTSAGNVSRQGRSYAENYPSTLDGHVSPLHRIPSSTYDGSSIADGPRSRFSVISSDDSSTFLSASHLTHTSYRMRLDSTATPTLTSSSSTSSSWGKLFGKKKSSKK